MACLCLSLAVYGCGGGSQRTPTTSLAAAASARAAAVVADISVGTNPYHEVFRRPAWTEHPCKVIAGFPCDAPALNLTLGGNYAADLAADSASWASYKPGIVYWVPGTNLLLLTLRSVAPVLCSGECDLKDGYGGPSASHGIATSGAAAAACADCYVLVIQDAPAADGNAVEYVASQLPWVDFLAGTNLSGAGNPFDTSNFALENYQQPTQHLADSGRLFFAASGDDAVTASYDGAVGPGYSLPPWVVTVGGMTATNPFPDSLAKDCNAIDVLSGAPAEILGAFSQNLPTPETVDGYKIQRGTSFAAPQMAAYFGQALARVRQRLGDTRADGALWAGAPQASGWLQDGVLTAVEMRGVFSQAAHYFQPSEFSAACEAEMDQKFLAMTSIPVSQRPVSATPWVDMGWGYVGPQETALSTAALLGAATLAPKQDAALAYMDGFMSARENLFPIP